MTTERESIPNKPQPRKYNKRGFVVLLAGAAAYLSTPEPVKALEVMVNQAVNPELLPPKNQVIEGIVAATTASGLLVARGKDQLSVATTSPVVPNSERVLTPKDSELRVDLDVKHQSRFYNLPWWWPFDRNYAASIGHPWLFADGGPLDAYDQATDEVFGAGRGNLREKWRDYAEKKMASLPASAKGWVGGCAWSGNTIYSEDEPQEGGRFSKVQKAGALALWHATDIPRFMSVDATAFDIVFNEGDWLIGNVPTAPGNRWYHIMIARSGAVLKGGFAGSGTGTKDYGIGSITEAYRPFPFSPEDNIESLSPQLKKLFYENVAELYEKDSMSRTTINYMLAA